MQKHTIVVTPEVFQLLINGSITSLRYQFLRNVREKDKLIIYRSGEVAPSCQTEVIHAVVKEVKRHWHSASYIRDYSLKVNLQLVLF